MEMWMFLLLVTTPTQAVPIRMAVPTEEVCKAEGKLADDSAAAAGVKVKWTCAQGHEE
jgi:hypothetical protein